MTDLAEKLTFGSSAEAIILEALAVDHRLHCFPAIISKTFDLPRGVWFWIETDPISRDNAIECIKRQVEAKAQERSYRVVELEITLKTVHVHMISTN